MYRVLTYGFPLLLLLFEWGLRVALQVDTSTFRGPALTAASLSVLIPLVEPREVKIPATPTSAWVIVSSRYDTRYFVPFAWLLVLLFLFAWAASCYFALMRSDLQVGPLEAHFALGMATYGLSVIMCELKRFV